MQSTIKTLTEADAAKPLLGPGTALILPNLLNFLRLMRITLLNGSLMNSKAKRRYRII
jgi:hypothetical protein